ncbi:MAG: hypothetical protein ACYTGL_12075 [Planctomycetota bacterium]
MTMQPGRVSDLIRDCSVALHVACRLTLIAFATVSAQGVLEGAAFEGVILSALRIAAGVFFTGLLIGEITRRLIEDMVNTTVKRILDKQTTRDGQQEMKTAAA